jgi:uncharacterized membrane protein YcjF (UPF0283 family)
MPESAPDQPVPSEDGPDREREREGESTTTTTSENEQDGENEVEVESNREDEADQILNAETERALRQAGRKLWAVFVGGLTAIMLLSASAVTALLSVSWQVHLGVTLAVSVAAPLAAAYVMGRVYGLSHAQTIQTGRRAVSEATTAAATLSEQQPSDEDHTESTEADSSTHGVLRKMLHRNADESAESDTGNELIR